MHRISFGRVVPLSVGALIIIMAATPAIVAQVDRLANRELPDGVAALKLEAPIAVSGVSPALNRSLAAAVGEQEVIVRLKTPSVARGGSLNAIQGEQLDFLDRCLRGAPSAQLIAKTHMVLNAVFLTVDAADLPALAGDQAVMYVKPVADYEQVLSETVPYIGAAAAQAAGIDGDGIDLAVLDSGIAYTHANLGGPGTPPAYEAAYGTSPSDPRNTSRDGLFPTSKVVEGFDFVGEAWPNGPLSPDPDPIDFDGHGTHVADISGGLGGVAPGVDLFAVKVCSAVTPSCSGIALIQGMDFAVDPNGDGDPSDAVDVINMSLGSDYGDPFHDDLSAAVENATALGVVTVAAAGNGSDKPYVQGTPAGAPSAISVAQTNVPSAGLQLINVGNLSGIPAVFQAWSTPLGSAATGSVQHGDGAGGNLNGCAPFTPGSLSGLVVLVDRGTCFFTTKIFNIGNAGGSVGIIGLVAPGAPFSGAFADPGGPITIPGYMISQADSTAIQFAIPAIGSVDPNNILPLVGAMVSSSSRGPQINDNRIKPEIGAPGGSVSAKVGTGDGETGILNDALVGDNAPITRIGAGEVRVDVAARSAAAAWDNDDPASGGALSFGFHDVADQTLVLTRTVRVRNFSDERIRFDVTPSFRFDDDEASGAVSIDAPSRISVRGGRDRTFDVEITINGNLLPANSMNSGSQGNNPAALTANEFDGYLTLDPVRKNDDDDDDELRAEQIHLAWHVLPRKAAQVAPSTTQLQGGGFPELIGLNNTGVGTAQNDAYALVALSGNIPEGGPGQQAPTPDIASVGINTFTVPAGFCSGQPSFVWAFAVNSHERQRHLVQPVSYQITLDTNQDGIDDYVVLNRDNSVFTTLNRVMSRRLLKLSGGSSRPKRRSPSRQVLRLVL